VENEESNQEITEQQISMRFPTGQLMLEDNFSFFNTSLWKREIKMPLDPVGILSLFCIIKLLKMQ
jgi:hypothetical protein